MKFVWRIVDELWQLFWWMLGIGVIAYVVGESLKGFLGLPVWLKFSLWAAIAVLCKHWRDIRQWNEKQRMQARQHPDLRI